MELMRYTLYGTLANRSRIIGYCHKHKAGVTAKQLKQKGCLRQQCHYLKRYTDHPFWIERQTRKEAKKCQ